MTLFGTDGMDARLDGLDELVAGSLRSVPVLRFTVYGEPKPAGSKTSGVAYKDGKPIEKNGKIVTFTKDSSGAPGKAWRQEVAAAGLEARLRAPWGDELALGALVVEMTFYRPRPKGHYGTGANAGVVRASAPPAPATRPDVLKLARAAEDALTSILWKDDAQIVDEHLLKLWGEPERVEITVGVY